jgi:hypothetical protein
MQKDIEVTLYGVKVKELSPKTYIKHVSSRSLLWNILSITQNLLANNSKNTKQPSTWLPFDLEESVRRTVHWIDEAGKAGCKFIAFPELCEYRFTSKGLSSRSAFTKRSRDPWLPVLGLEGQLPGESATSEEVSREQSPFRFGGNAPHP